MTATARPSAVGGYEDWQPWIAGRPLLSGDDLAARLATALGVPAPTPDAGVRLLRTWSRDGVVTDELEWTTGVGPRTRAWVVRPERARGPLPGVLALHCHAGVKSIGAERLVRVEQPTRTAQRLRRDLYDGRALAEDLARRGAVVLAHDTFAWGARRFRLDPPPASLADVAGPDPYYDALAAPHEHVVAKAAGMLGTSFAGMAAHDDLVAAAVLRTLPGVDAERIGTLGFSGGGGRAATLAALDPGVRAHVVVAMMTTTAALFPGYADAHSWLLATPGLFRTFDLPRIAAARANQHPLVLSFAEDPLFPRTGVRDAHARLRDLGVAEAVLAGGHVFSRQAQDRATTFLLDRLGRHGGPGRATG